MINEEKTDKETRADEPNKNNSSDETNEDDSAASGENIEDIKSPDTGKPAPELHPPKHLNWIAVMTIVLIIVLVGVMVWVAYRKAGIAGLQSYLPTGNVSEEQSTESVAAEDGYQWHREPLAGLKFQYDPKTTMIYAYENLPDEAVTEKGTVNDASKVEIGVNIVDLTKDIELNSVDSYLRDIIDNLSGAVSTTNVITTTNQFKFMPLSELDPGMGCTEGWVMQRGNLLFHLYTWTAVCDLENTESTSGAVSASVAESVLRSVVESVVYMPAKEITKAEKDLSKLDEYHLYDVSTTKQDLADEMQSCDGEDIGDVTGDGVADLVVNYSSCGSGTHYPVVLTMHNGFLQDFVLPYPSNSFTGVKNDSAGPDTGLTVVTISGGQINVVVPVHSETDECHTCITGGVENILYKWTGSGFEVESYNYNPYAASPI